MATIKLKNLLKHPLFKGISGKIGGYVFRRMKDKIIISSAPRKRNHDSPLQKKRTAAFKRAAAYAKCQMCDPVSEADYRNGITDRKFSAYMVALADYLNAPKIHDVDTGGYRGVKGNSIYIDATDDFRVITVEVSITGSDGVLIEKGLARGYKNSKRVWYYKICRTNKTLPGTKISITVRDKPGNATSAEKILE
jgi:hypothetical protein